MPDTVSAEMQRRNGAGAAWYALWTRSNCERVVDQELRAKGFDTFLPQVKAWSTRNAMRRVQRRPLFPGYLFVHNAMDRDSYVEIAKARGLVRILGDGWNHLSVVPDAQVESVRRVVESQLYPTPFPFLKEGQRVRVRHGPLAGVEGIILRRKDGKALLVVTIELFRRSLSVEIDCTCTEAA